MFEKIENVLFDPPMVDEVLICLIYCFDIEVKWAIKMQELDEKIQLCLIDTKDSDNGLGSHILGPLVDIKVKDEALVRIIV